MTLLTLKVKCLVPHVQLPKYYTSGSSGLDLCYAGQKPLNMVYGEIYRVPTGIAVEIPEGYEGQIRPRSSLAARGIIILNAPGTIDSDYRGEIQVLMYNLMHTPYQIVPGDRIAQLVITKVARTHIQVVEELTATERDTSGFGSTGR